MVISVSNKFTQLFPGPQVTHSGAICCVCTAAPLISISVTDSNDSLFITI